MLLALLLYLCSFSSFAVFHLWNISEIYSNDDGSVQYIELFTQASGQQFVSGHDINSLEQDNSTRATFTFPTNSPAGTSGRHLLLATSGFSDVAGVNPDFTIPENFLSLAGGTVQFVGAGMLAFGVFPSDSSLAIQNDGSVATASPTNFAGVVGSIAGLDPIDGCNGKKRTITLHGFSHQFSCEIPGTHPHRVTPPTPPTPPIVVPY